MGKVDNAWWAGGKREYESEMEYAMKGGFLRPRDSNVPSRRLVTTYLSYFLSPGVRSLPSHFVSFPLSPHLCRSPRSRLRTLGPPSGPHATRVVCPVRPFALAFLYARWATHRQLAREIYTEREASPQKRHKGRSHALKGNDASVASGGGLGCGSRSTFENSSSCHATSPTFSVERGIMFYGRHGV